MHEMSLAEGVRTLIEDAAAADGSGHVRAVVLEIGELAAVEVEALRFCLDVVLADTIAAGAAIEVETLPGAGWCPACAQRCRCTSSKTPARTAAATACRPLPAGRCA